MHIVWTFPDVPSYQTMFMLETMTFKVGVEVNKNVDISTMNMQVEAWTNIYDKDNPEGLWHAIPLDLISGEQTDEGKIIATYGNSVFLTSDGTYAFTFRAKFHTDESYWSWSGNFKDDGIVEVRPPFDDVWSKGPNFDHICGVVHLGNFMTASVADELGFDAVLNVADNLDLIPSKFSKPVHYHKIPMQDGAHNQIPDEYLYEAIEWLREKSQTCTKVLVNCRAGIGRAGSVAVGFVFATNPSLSFTQAYDMVYSKRFVYPHRGLKDTLLRLYPRQT